MKTKQDVIQDFLEKAEETLLKIDVRMGYVQNKYAAENHKHYLEELAQLTADKKETEDWIKYLKDQGNKKEEKKDQ